MVVSWDGSGAVNPSGHRPCFMVLLVFEDAVLMYPGADDRGEPGGQEEEADKPPAEPPIGSIDTEPLHRASECSGRHGEPEEADEGSDGHQRVFVSSVWRVGHACS